MGDRTGIEWSDSTWNPWFGCRRVSPGCARCYADQLVTHRWKRDFRTVTRTVDASFYRPRHWRTGRRVFTCSLSDFFIEDADALRPDVWETIRLTPRHTYQILTKRPENIRERLPPDWNGGWDHVWLGVSAETWDHLRARAELLSAVPTKHRFVSMEPWLDDRTPDTLTLGHLTSLFSFDWVILGGESGPGARPMDLASAAYVQRNLAAQHIPFFLKQLGGYPDKRSHDAAMLDGRTFKELP